MSRARLYAARIAEQYAPPIGNRWAHDQDAGQLFATAVARPEGECRGGDEGEEGAQGPSGPDALAENPDATRDIYAERCACGAALERQVRGVTSRETPMQRGKPISTTGVRNAE
jgi:hypothetical protein